MIEVRLKKPLTEEQRTALIQKGWLADTLLKLSGEHGCLFVWNAGDLMQHDLQVMGIEYESVVRKEQPHA